VGVVVRGGSEIISEMEGGTKREGGHAMTDGMCLSNTQWRTGLKHKRRNDFFDMSGQRFGRLIVMGRAANKKHRIYWRVRCECGKEKTVRGECLKNGKTKSCGCYRRETTRKLHATHGLSKSRTYFCWQDMRSRCCNKNDTGFKNYGARGISVCERWEKFENFLQDMGPRPDGLMLERINNNAGYSPNNCKWASRSEQNNNTRRVHLITHGGVTLSMSAWGRRSVHSISTMCRRLERGWSLEKALVA
jgi:hypothetical protein